jgi:DNA-binding transcriptional regulator YiaG
LAIHAKAYGLHEIVKWGARDSQPRSALPAAGDWDARSVAELRDELGLSQDGLSRALGVRQQTVSDWETGAHKPTGASLTLLSMVKDHVAEYRTRAR